ncbi:MAG TPA: chromate transporter [Burkholderiaceae bacterium]
MTSPDLPPAAPPSPPAASPAAGGPASILDEPSPRAPQSTGELFRVFTRLALQGFGGVLPVAQRELVERERWLTREQFVEMLAVAQVLPGPNVVNLSLMFGDRAFGWRGGLAALAGMLAAPLGVVLVLTLVYLHFASDPVVAGALRGMGAVAAGLILSTGLKLLTALRRNVLGAGLAWAFAGATVLAIAVARVPLIWALAVLGGAAFALAWRRLPR